MADTTFKMVLPALKAIDLVDGAYALAIADVNIPGGGTDITFVGVSPPLKAIDLGDGTYAMATEIR
jgi:hypothetical protein